ncbi:MAG TPA: hypothetical protein ENK08_10030 [Chloroflexi bacterium]|nr:hypothetical protein [Chloroflexota bacterium]
MGKKKKAIPRPMTKKERSRLARERRLNRIVIGGAIAVGVLIVGVLIYGYVTEVVLKAREPVAVVNGVPIRTDEWQARVLAEAILEDASQQELVSIAGRVLEQMAQEEIIRQEAARQGIVVTDEEIDLAIEQFFGYNRERAAEATTSITATEGTTQTTVVTEEEFRQRYQDYIDRVLEPSGMGVEGFRKAMEGALLYDRVWDVVTADVPTITEQVEIEYIAFSSEEDAASIADRLDQGEEWETITQELADQEDSGVRVAEPRWRTRSYLTDLFDPASVEIIFSLEPGEHTRPIAGFGGQYYVVRVLSHEERELDPTMLIYEKGRAFQTWMQQQMENVEYADDWMEKIPSLPGSP